MPLQSVMTAVAVVGVDAVAEVAVAVPGHSPTCWMSLHSPPWAEEGLEHVQPVFYNDAGCMGWLDNLFLVSQLKSARWSWGGIREVFDPDVSSMSSLVVTEVWECLSSCVWFTFLETFILCMKPGGKCI